MAWTLAWPGVDGAIVGARRPAQLDDWIDAASITLDGATLDAIAAVLSETGAGHGPLRPPPLVHGPLEPVPSRETVGG